MHRLSNVLPRTTNDVQASLRGASGMMNGKRAITMSTSASTSTSTLSLTSTMSASMSTSTIATTPSGPNTSKQGAVREQGTSTTLTVDTIDRTERTIRKLRKLHECPVCSGYVPANGFGCVCKGEHVVCAPCYKLLEPTAPTCADVEGQGGSGASTPADICCPHCRGKIVSTHASQFWTETTALLDWPCRFGNCTFVGNVAQIQAHVSICAKRDVACPVTHCTTHWKVSDTAAHRGEERHATPSSFCAPRHLFSLLRRDHADIPVITIKAVLLIRCIIAAAGEDFPTQGATWGVILEPRGHNSDHRIYLEIEYKRRAKCLQAAAFHLYEPTSADDEDLTFITHVFISVGDPVEEVKESGDNDPYMRRIPVVHPDHNNELPRRHIYSLHLYPAIDAGDEDDTPRLYYISKRKDQSESQYIEVRVELMHKRALPHDNVELVIVNHLTRNRRLSKPPPTTAAVTTGRRRQPPAPQSRTAAAATGRRPPPPSRTAATTTGRRRLPPRSAAATTSRRTPPPLVHTGSALTSNAHGGSRATRGGSSGKSFTRARTRNPTNTVMAPCKPDVFARSNARPSATNRPSTSASHSDNQTALAAAAAVPSARNQHDSHHLFALWSHDLDSDDDDGLNAYLNELDRRSAH